MRTLVGRSYGWRIVWRWVGFKAYPLQNNTILVNRFFLNGAKFVGHIKVLVNVLMFVGVVTLHGLFFVHGFNVGPPRGRVWPSCRSWVQLPLAPLM